MTTWIERTPGAVQVPYFPRGIGSGRFDVDLTDVGLRFKDLGSGRVGLDPTGLYVGVSNSSGRFFIGLLSGIWTERTAGATSWSERTEGSTAWSERVEGSTSWTERSAGSTAWTERTP